MSASVMPCTPVGVAIVLSSVVAHSSISFENGFGGPVISTGAAPPCHSIVKRAAARLDLDPGIEQAEADAGDDRGAGAGAAGQRSRRRRARARAGGWRRRETICMKPALTPSREARVLLDPRPERRPPARVTTSATICTACGLPIDTSATSTVRPSPSSSGQSAGRAQRARAIQVVSKRTAPGRNRARPCRPSRRRRRRGAARGGGSWSRRASVVLSLEALSRTKRTKQRAPLPQCSTSSPLPPLKMR